MLLAYIIGGTALGLLGYRYLSKRHPAVQQAEVANQQKKALETAMKGLGFSPHTPTNQDFVKNQVDKAMSAIGFHHPGSAGATPGIVRPRLVQGDPLNTVTGKTYYVTMRLSVPAFMAGRDQIVQEAQNHGFVDVVASPTMPQGWPGTQTGDWYVKARAARPSQFQRQKGVMTIVEGFEQ